MKAQQLKNSILQYAMEGKLVLQDPDDEPASVLLEGIKEEKEQLIKDKVIKREKPLSPITNEEISYEIPDSWEWVRLNDICFKINDGTHHTPTYTNVGIPFLSVKDMSKRKLDFSNSKFISKEEHEKLYKRCNPEYGDVLITKVGTTGIPVIVDTHEQFSLFVSVALLKFNQDLIFNKYLFYMIDSPVVYEQSKNNTRGVGNKNLVIIAIKNFIIPIPPLAEQKRIVQKIEELKDKVDKYDVLEKEITSLTTSFPTDMEKSILQYAMQGKLVEQDANDESASVLLEKIKDEREQLIKDKIIKREKALAPITDDEIPFEIPNSWKWIRLNEISNIGQFKSIKGTIIEDEEWVLDLVEIEKDSGILLEKVMKSQKSVLSNKYIFSKGNVLYGKLRPYLNKVIVADQCGYCTTEILPLDFGSYIFSNYAKHVLMSPYFLDYVNNCSYGVKMPRLGTADAKNALFPLPPLAEQKRIVAKIEEMQELTNKMKYDVGLASSPK